MGQLRCLEKNSLQVDCVLIYPKEGGLDCYLQAWITI